MPHSDLHSHRASCHEVSADCKAMARSALLGHLGIATGSSVTYFLIVFVLQMLLFYAVPGSGALSLLLSELMSILLGILAGVLQYGLFFVNLKLQFRQEVVLSDLFLGFRENTDKLVKIYAFLAILQTICLLPSLLVSMLITGKSADVLYWLFLALGLVLYLLVDLTFFAAGYLLLDYPSLSARDALKKSHRLMKHHRLQLFWMELSFLPLWLLVLCSFGIAGIWVMAYQNAAMAAFYRKQIEG